ncbi:MAG TPA: PIN domain-containing protein [Solirubrobacterales bacterium]|nr:PIN domain-containing protein [Solirubrobacterales bacterium]
MLLLDASVWVAAGISAHPSHGPAAALARGGAPVAALDLTLYEVINAVARGYRQPAQAERIVRAIVRTCGDGLSRVDAELGGQVADLVARHGLTAYDAAYVAVARRNGWQLVSLDVRNLVSKGLAVTPDAADYP